MFDVVLLILFELVLKLAKEMFPFSGGGEVGLGDFDKGWLVG